MIKFNSREFKALKFGKQGVFKGIEGAYIFVAGEM
jgi:hypothetical protein